MTSPKVSPPRPRSRRRRKVIHPLGADVFEQMRASQVAWGNRLLSLLGAPIPGERTLEVLADQLEAIVGEPYDIFFHSARTFEGAEFDAQVEGLWATTFALDPDPDLGLIGMDLNLVQGCLEALLEDEPTEVRTLLPVTPRDFGLVSFVLMELLHWLCLRGLPPLSIPATAPDPRIIARQFSKHREIVELVYAVNTATSAGLVRLFLPSVMVQTMEIFATRGTHLNRQRRRLNNSRLGRLRTRLGVEAARVSLGLQELERLAVGDILMPEQHGFDFKEGPDAAEQALPNARDAPPAARIYLRGLAGDYIPGHVRPGPQQSWQVEFCARVPISPSAARSTLSAQSSQPSQNPKTQKEESMPSQEIQRQREDAAQLGPLLEKTQVEVQISVGQVMLSMSELAQLQSGYVLELDKSVKDGVDLYVDGAQIGVGELVLVEQRLGVRVLAIQA